MTIPSHPFPPPPAGARVAVGMSGGVDSCAAALILKEQGYEVVGITLKVWEEEENPDRRWQERSCCKVGIARYVAERLGIEHRVVDVREDFRSGVVQDFITGYLEGETPNPCVRCNERIKFGRLLEIAREAGASHLATGHYVRLGREDAGGRPVLQRAADEEKDQSYFLYRIPPSALPSLIFPLGGLRKAEVWDRVESLDLPAGEMRESQEICFVTQSDYRRFLAVEAPEASRPGPILSTEGERLGDHTGVAHYTVGQRRGLGVSSPKRLYVIETRPSENKVVLGTEDELYHRELVAVDLNLFVEIPPGRERRVMAKFRYRAPAAPARIVSPRPGALRVMFETPQRALTPGQSVVFYERENLLGGGVIRTIGASPPAPRPREDGAAAGVGLTSH